MHDLFNTDLFLQRNKAITKRLDYYHCMEMLALIFAISSHNYSNTFVFAHANIIWKTISPKINLMFDSIALDF